MAVGLLMTFFAPILFSMAGDASCAVRNDGVRNIIVKMTFVGGGMTVGAGLLTAFLHPYIFHILVSEKYASASYLLPWLVLSSGLFAIAQVLASLLMTLNMTAKLSFASIGSSIIGILASILCVKNFGLDGMIAASLIHSASYLLLVTLTIRTTKNS
jgi:O-antigen/teichoic acid export membrane protein